MHHTGVKPIQQMIDLSQSKKTLDYERLYLYNLKMVRAKGFEPPTFGTGNQHSIQLSYARVAAIITDRIWCECITGVWVLVRRSVIKYMKNVI